MATKDLPEHATPPAGAAATDDDRTDKLPVPDLASRRLGGGAIVLRSLGFAILCCGVLCATALGVYMLELDHTIRAKFAGKRWALPAKVYARPLELFAGMDLSQAQFLDELQFLAYQKTETPTRPGTYQQRGNLVDIYTRHFRFWDSTETARKIRLTFKDDALRYLTALDGKAPVTLMRLDPMEIAGIYPAHGEDRILLQTAQLPEALVDTLLAVEDRSFYQHFGVDIRGITRAMMVNLRQGRLVQGGSTLTQQLVKNFFLSNERTLARKLNEMLMALLIEWHYDKDEILEAYANEIYLGQDGSRSIHGFGLASQFYFDRTLDELQLHQIALLVGLIRGPSSYDPKRFPERARQRRELVLNIMVERNLISAAEAKIAHEQPLDLAQQTSSGTTRYPDFLDLVRRQLKENYREEDLTSEGLRVFTTLDPLAQEQAEQAFANMLPKLEKKGRLEENQLQAATVIANTQTGEVKAIIGDRDARQVGFNRALSAKRPAGSLLKPAVYLTALEQPFGYTLATLLDDSEEFIHFTQDGQLWEPKNYDKKYHGWVMLRDALAKSYNIPTARLGLDLNISAVVKTLQRLGLERALNPYPSLVLGAVDLSPFDIAQIYLAFASGGYRLPLRAITEVVATSGKPLPRLYSLSLEKAIDPGPAFLINNALQKVVESGTATVLRRQLPADLNLAGKTGTTDDLRDSWFAGFSGNLLNVVWVGRDDNQPINLTGAKGALPLWSEIMQRLALEPLLPHEPAAVEQILIDPRSGLLATSNCRGAQWVPFLLGSAPNDFAPCVTGQYSSRENSAGDANNNVDTDSMGTFFRRLLE